MGGRDKLAVLTGIQGGTLSGYNTGRLNLGGRNAQRIATALDVSLFDLGAPETPDAEALTPLDRLAEVEDDLAEAVRGVAKLTRQMSRLQARVSKLEAQPVPRPDVAGSADG